MRCQGIKQILYVLISLFLLCNFCQFAHEETNGLDFSVKEQTEISLQVPNGAHMEIKSEKNTADTLVKTKPISLKTLLGVRFIFFVILMAMAGIISFSACQVILKSRSIYSRVLVISYIHNKDGRKRQ